MSLSVIETREKLALMEEILEPILVRDLIPLIRSCFRGLEPGQEYTHQMVKAESGHELIATKYMGRECAHEWTLDAGGDPFKFRLGGAVRYNDAVETGYAHVICLDAESLILWAKICGNFNAKIAKDKLNLICNKKLITGIYEVIVSLSVIMDKSTDRVVAVGLRIEEADLVGIIPANQF